MTGMTARPADKEQHVYFDGDDTEYCDECEGEGVCPDCDGDGCGECEDNGTCPQCGGSGLA